MLPIPSRAACPIFNCGPALWLWHAGSAGNALPASARMRVLSHCWMANFVPRTPSGPRMYPDHAKGNCVIGDDLELADALAVSLHDPDDPVVRRPCRQSRCSTLPLLLLSSTLPLLLRCIRPFSVPLLGDRLIC